MSIMKAYGMLVALIGGVSLLIGCSAGYPARYYHVAADPLRPEQSRALPFQFVTWDGYEYRLTSCSIDSIIVQGEGKVRRGVRDRWEEFSGSVLLDDVALVSVRQGSFGSTMVLGAATATAVYGVLNADQSNSATVDAAFRYIGGGGGGSSCPYVYSWDGDEFILEAEPFGIALGRALELTTGSVLPSLSSDSGVVRLRIADERPETHYLNHVELYAVERDGGHLALDVHDGQWVIHDKQPPCEAIDHSGNDVRELVSWKDSLYWQSDRANTNTASGFEDMITLEFQNALADTSGLLLIRGVNTEFGAFAFDNMLRFLRDDWLQFMYRVENDPETIAALKEWIRITSVTVEQWNGTTWDSIGVMSPEATAVPFTRAFPITAPIGSSEGILIRLKALTDIWRLDSVQIDWNAKSVTGMRKLPLTSALGSHGGDYVSDIRRNDNEYAVLLPGDYIDVTFKDDGATSSAHEGYILMAGGYLHRWMPRSSETAVTPVALLPGCDRTTAVEFLLKHKELLLPGLYAAWACLPN